MQNKLAHTRTARSANQSPGLRSCSTMVITQAASGFTIACARVLVREIVGHRYDRSPGYDESRHEPLTFRRTSGARRGTATPDPSASTMPTHSRPGLAGSVG